MAPKSKSLFVSIVLASLLLCRFLSAGVADELIERSGVEGGLVVVLDSEQITSEMRVNDRYLVQGLFADDKSKLDAREHIQSKGVYGPVTVKSWDGERLPYLDNMVNLLIVPEKARGVSTEEVMRALAPNGVHMINDGSQWSAHRKEWPDSIDDWTHWLHSPDNNAVSGDAYKEIPRGMQWIQNPRWWKSHELAPPFSAMVSAKGRLFYIADESLPGIANVPDRWYLIARDAFNGTLLWKKPIEEWGMKYWMPKGEVKGVRHPRVQSPRQVARRLVAIDDKVFVTLGLFAPVSMLDAATGAVLKTFDGTENAFEILAEGERLYLAVNSGLSDQTPGPDVSVMAVDVNSSEILWRTKAYRGFWQVDTLAPQYVDMCLTLGREGLFFIDEHEVVGLDLETGKKKWAQERYEESALAKKLSESGTVSSPGVLNYYDSILFYGHAGKSSKMSLRALDADSGNTLWEDTGDSIAYHAAQDLFVNHGLVWSLNTSDWTYEGLDPRTGAKKQTMDMSLIKQGTHHNCYRNKATQEFILYGRNKGIEYFNVEANEARRLNWIKGACRYGIMPANGMIYFPSHFCTCYATSKLNGFVAIGNTGVSEAKPSTSNHITKGPSYGKDFSSGAWEKDWPTYRRNISRTGYQQTPLSADIALKWTAPVKGALTPPVAADQKVFVASKDDCRVVCIDAETGSVNWTFLPDGKVDSPPSYYKGRLVFGARDGSVYCLDAQSGRLAWRFRAAPQDKQMGAFERVESVWPVHGTLIVHDDKVLCVAGRHTNVNTGIYLYQLDVDTGQPLVSANHIPDISEQGETETTVNMDVLVGDGNIMHIRGMVFDMKTLKMIDKGRRFIERILQSKGERMQTNLIMALGGFLEESYFNGSFWDYNNTTANILSLDESHLYGVNVYTKNAFKSHTHVNFYPGEGNITLFASGIKSTTSGNKSKGPKTTWTTKIPIKAKSLLVGSDSLYLAGVRDIVDEQDPWAHYDGRMGGMLTIHSKSDGKLKREIDLKSPAVFDGLASAGGKLFISCKDGSVLCFE